jgi:opacity protein-like surface antigen
MKRLMLAVGVVLSVGANALAQDAGQIGITMAFPSAVGVIYQVTDNVAVRPEISFSTGSTESPAIRSTFSFPDVSVDLGETSSTTVTAGVSGLFYFGEWDKLRAYVSPRYAYGRLTSNTGSTFAADNRNSTYAVTGSFGAHYQLHHRFAVFGETGFGYNHSRTTFTSIIGIPLIPVGPNVPAPVSRSEEINSHSWATRSGAGVIFYFK